MNVVKPPHSLVSNRRNSTSIFLAGSIENGTASNWQDEVEDYFSKSGKSAYYTIYNPRRDKWDPDLAQEYENPQFYQQVNWELNALDKADVIIMYFDPSTKSPISLMELGLYASSGKINVVCPKDFWRSGNVEIVCEKYGIPLFRNLEDLLEEF